MTDERKTPPLGRARTDPEDRDVYRPKTSPFGVRALPPAAEPESWEGADGLTPIGDLLPDPIEVAAVRIEQRAEAIRDRPGPTPPPEALQSAITIHGVRAELHAFKDDVKGEFQIVHRKVDEVAGVVLTGMSKELDRRRDEAHLVLRQKTEVGTAADIAKIDVDAAKAKARIETRAKIVMTLLGLATAVMAVLEARHC